jgi:hypothetical protein
MEPNEMVVVTSRQVPLLVPSQFHHVKPRLDNDNPAVVATINNRDVGDNMTGPVRRKLRPGLGVTQALNTHAHQIAVLAADTGAAVRRRIIGMSRYPIKAGLSEEIQPSVPIARIQTFGLPVKKPLDFVSKDARRSCMRSALNRQRGRHNPIN